MRFFDGAAVDAALSYPALVDTLQAAFAKGAIAPPRHHHAVALDSRPEATLLLMPAWEASAPGSHYAGRYIGLKAVTVYPDNATRGAPAVLGTYLLLSAETGATLAVMDAKNLAFRDCCFDAVVAQYVITAVPDPERTLDDFIRVLKPGGELILVNHIGAESGPRRIFELAFAPLARRLGWRPEFPWARLTDWAAKHGGVTLTERRPMPPMGHFSLIRFRKS